MKNFYCLIVVGGLLAGLFGLSGCDDGRLYVQEAPASPEGRTVSLTARLTGVSSWPQSSFYVAIAGFADDSEYAVISKTVPAPEQDGAEITVQLSDIKEEVSRVELCVISRLRKHVVSYVSIDKDELTAANEIVKDIGTLDVGMFHTIQEKVFNTTCVNCHGASTSAAGGLYLTGDRSYAAMAGVPSAKVEGLSIVEPGKADESALYRALATDVSQADGWRYNHTSEVVDEDMLALIKAWINNGAKEQ